MHDLTVSPLALSVAGTGPACTSDGPGAPGRRPVTVPSRPSELPGLGCPGQPVRAAETPAREPPTWWLPLQASHYAYSPGWLPLRGFPLWGDAGPLRLHLGANYHPRPRGTSGPRGAAHYYQGPADNPRTRRLPLVVLAALLVLLLTGAPAISEQQAHAAATWWQPGPLTSWQYDLEWPVAVPTNIGAVQVYDIDYDGSESGTEAQVTALVSQIHAAGSKALCYLETGAWESYRPDASDYPASVLGSTMPGYPDERYVDIRQWSVLEPILDARFEQCKAEGFDGVETDIDDSYTDDTGFPLSPG